MKKIWILGLALLTFAGCKDDDKPKPQPPPEETLVDQVVGEYAGTSLAITLIGNEEVDSTLTLPSEDPAISATVGISKLSSSEDSVELSFDISGFRKSTEPYLINVAPFDSANVIYLKDSDGQNWGSVSENTYTYVDAIATTMSGQPETFTLVAEKPE